MRGDERRVVDAFCEWLTEQGWAVEREVEFVDVRAERDGQVIFAEAKGRTSGMGLDVDTMFGQLLRRMRHLGDHSTRYAVVVPEEARRAVERVPVQVRDLLAIDVYVVSATNQVRPV